MTNIASVGGFAFTKGKQNRVVDLVCPASGGAKMRVLKTDEKKDKPRKIPSFPLEKGEVRTAGCEAAEIERMIEAKVAQALRILR